MAQKGVVATTVSQNVAFRMRQDPTLGPNLESTNHLTPWRVLQNMLAIGALPIHRPDSSDLGLL
ncbi:hypothetical protein [Parasutterella sp.]|uniref:hypothetical protein n=1 Tax=Parasutterella sp. TaxID=2049037 RepID=UPI003994142A